MGNIKVVPHQPHIAFKRRRRREAIANHFPTSTF
nr:MAG TPA: hypothetical protein [Herelleviridae sp.]